ncbi:hypothetical protein FEM48_Zijuj05G0061600 [Ziziphus jujuba var. spinosa]|uniref:Secreted protein n=1 Tax=Ziziphus jujuba var. spinosa TaxID=714518 RepID=A0A978VD94_ZIZJJ|nr:hypothetical protein FEM48_Zijuj05G0061600 [Ziziphus jujuba var. spinosa]
MFSFLAAMQLLCQCELPVSVTTEITDRTVISLQVHKERPKFMIYYCSWSSVREEKVKVLTPRGDGYAIQHSNKTLVDACPSTGHKKVDKPC